MNKNKNNNIDKHNELNEAIFDAILRKGAHEYLEENLPQEEDKPNELLPATSEEIILKAIKSQIRKEKATRLVKHMPRVAVIILIIIAVSAITIVSVEAFRIPVFNFFIKTTEEKTRINIEEEQSQDAGTTSYIFEPSYIPEGYELTSTEESGEIITLTYDNLNGNTLIIFKHSIDYTIGLDTENAEYGNLIIGEYEAYYSIKNGITQLLYMTDTNLFYIVSALELDELIKVAEGIN